MDIVTESELASMIMMSGGGVVISNMVDIIDKMPTLCTYTAGEYLFEFKFVHEPLWYEWAGKADDGARLQARACVAFVCRKGSKIICAQIKADNNGYATLYKTYYANGDNLYNIIHDVKMSVSVSSGVDTETLYFKLPASFTDDYYNNDKLSRSYSRNGYFNITIWGDGTFTHFFTNLPPSEFATEYANAYKAIEESISE